MSGKKKKRNAGKYAAPKKPGHDLPYIALAVGVLCLIVAVLICWRAGVFGNTGTQPPQPSDTGTQTTTLPTVTTTAPDIQIEIPEDVTIPLGNQLKITDLGSYTGIFMEDGSDEIVSGVMMILLTNEGDQTLQYAEITLGNAQDEKAYFSASTLPPGCSAVLLEKNRKPFAPGYEAIALDNVVFFQEEPGMLEDTVKIQAYQGAMNVTNISGADITGTIQIYYKNSAADVYYGGITYMAKIQGGLKSGETRQLMPSHFQSGSSTVMFVMIV